MRLLFLADQLALLLIYACLPVLLIARRAGAYVLFAGVVGHLTVHRTTGLIGSLELDQPMWPQVGARGRHGLSLAYGALLFLFLAGLLVSLAGAQFGALLLIVSSIGQFGADLAVGIRAYRETMRRPWPQVAPILDDDDW